MAKKSKKKSAKKKVVRSAPVESKGLGAVSLDDLEREMRRRQREVGKLVTKRDRLAAQVAEIDTQIKALGGVASAGSFGTTAAGKPRRRPQNTSSLSEALLGVLDSETMSVTEAAEAVQQAGYLTTSANFRMIVNQTLIKDPRFKKVSRGQYTAK